MSARRVLGYPDPRLREKAREVTAFGEAATALAKDLIDTLRADGPAIGLAATQIGEPLRMLLVDMSGTGDAPEIYVNPEILADAQPGIAEERCLSVPDLVVRGFRASLLKVRFQDCQGETHERVLEGMQAVCFQHELDHFEGKLLVDRLWFPRRAWYDWRHKAPTPAPAIEAS
ncbi:MAG: peptide deformylase [Myxococcota bacterium]